ncbi:MAG: hypothetical protein JXA71_06180 [Chitinispirillaceae bacterium]|nr:hypothetical protein [Chitinispirillaceae bacterium]
MLLKLVFWTIIGVILYRLVRGVFIITRKGPEGHRRNGEARRFDARGEDIDDGEFRELK